jgi:hypothetical protein
MDGWRIRHSAFELSDGMFVFVAFSAAVIGATAGTAVVWAWDRFRAAR